MTATTDKIQVMLEGIEFWYTMQGHKMWEYEHAEMWCEYIGMALILLILSPIALIVHLGLELILLGDWIMRIVKR